MCILNTKKKHLISFALFVIFALIGGASSDSGHSTSDTNTTRKRSNIYWLNEISDACNSYNRGKNEIQASEIVKEFKIHNNLRKDHHLLISANGTVKSINTYSGGDHASVEIEVDGYLFKDPDIKNGDKVYSQAANFMEGQCVQLSGSFTSSIPFIEKEEICPDGFVGTISDIIPCNKK